MNTSDLSPEDRAVIDRVREAWTGDIERTPDQVVTRHLRRRSPNWRYDFTDGATISEYAEAHGMELDEVRAAAAAARNEYHAIMRAAALHEIDTSRRPSSRKCATCGGALERTEIRYCSPPCRTAGRRRFEGGAGDGRKCALPSCGKPLKIKRPEFGTAPNERRKETVTEFKARQTCGHGCRVRLATHKREQRQEQRRQRASGGVQ